MKGDSVDGEFTDFKAEYSQAKGPTVCEPDDRSAFAITNMGF